MYANLLFPTDFSPAADQLLTCLKDIQPLGFKQIVLAHVIDVRQAANILGFDSSFWERQGRLAQAELRQRRAQVESMGYACHTVQVEDVPWRGIIETAKRERCDLIVMGSHGKTRMQEAMLGSVSEGVARHSPVPVLIPKLQVIEEEGREVCKFACARMLHKVLVPIDFSDCGQVVLDVVRQLGIAGTRELVLQHVQDVRKLRPHLAERMPEFNRIDTQRLADLRAQLKCQGFQTKTWLTEGVPWKEILRAAHEEDVGMIVLCSHGCSALPETLLGSVSAEVLRHSPQAVLIVPWAEARKQEA